MYVTIYYNGRYQDQLSFECDSIEEAREHAYAECEKRNWESDKCHSEISE